jgi:hypothetical protein
LYYLAVSNNGRYNSEDIVNQVKRGTIEYFYEIDCRAMLKNEYDIIVTLSKFMRIDLSKLTIETGLSNQKVDQENLKKFLDRIIKNTVAYETTETGIKLYGFINGTILSLIQFILAYEDYSLDQKEIINNILIHEYPSLLGTDKFLYSFYLYYLTNFPTSSVFDIYSYGDGPSSYVKANFWSYSRIIKSFYNSVKDSINYSLGDFLEGYLKNETKLS